jgi:hypothetical protein
MAPPTGPPMGPPGICFRGPFLVLLMLI